MDLLLKRYIDLENSLAKRGISMAMTLEIVKSVVADPKTTETDRYELLKDLASTKNLLNNLLEKGRGNIS